MGGSTTANPLAVAEASGTLIRSAEGRWADNSVWTRWSN